MSVLAGGLADGAGHLDAGEEVPAATRHVDPGVRPLRQHLPPPHASQGGATTAHGNPLTGW